MILIRQAKTPCSYQSYWEKSCKHILRCFWYFYRKYIFLRISKPKIKLPNGAQYRTFKTNAKAYRHKLDLVIFFFFFLYLKKKKSNVKFKINESHLFFAFLRQNKQLIHLILNNIVAICSLNLIMLSKSNILSMCFPALVWTSHGLLVEHFVPWFCWIRNLIYLDYASNNCRLESRIYLQK